MSDDLQHRWRDMHVDERIKHVNRYVVVVGALFLLILITPLFPFFAARDGFAAAAADYRYGMKELWRDVTA